MEVCFFIYVMIIIVNRDCYVIFDGVMFIWDGWILVIGKIVDLIFKYVDEGILMFLSGIWVIDCIN